jgi:hypothetical protein
MLRLDDQCILCDDEGRALCQLNETASAVWELCDGETTPDEMIEAICGLCAVEPDVADRDVKLILAEFNLVEVIEW